MLTVFLTATCRFTLATVLSLAGTAKLLAPDRFERAVADYQLLPDRLTSIVARAVPIFELLLGAALLLGLGLTWSGAVAALALAVFSAAVIANLIRGRGIDCGCFNLLGQTTITWAVPARNLALIAAALFLVIHGQAPLSLSQLWTHASDPAFAAVAGAACALLALAAVNLAGAVWTARRRIRVVAELEGLP